MLFCIDINEINFEMISEYAKTESLPNFAELLDKHKVYETTSEELYEEWEPWIQWVTVQTGLTLKDHGVFRLGDIVKTELPQIWETLAQQGHRICAISPMNAMNRLNKPHVFVPDPWTNTKVTAPPEIEKLAAAIADLVNGNATGGNSRSSYLDFARGLVRFSRVENYAKYIELVLKSRSRKWSRALLLDLLLADVFLANIKSQKFDYASLFLNSGAHIQHHYMFSSKFYQGTFSNPDTIVPAGADPVFDAYSLYDRIIGQVRRASPDARLIIRTGLHQVPHEQETYYWRLKKHEDFFRGFGLEFMRISPKMSRDFVVEFSSEEQARKFSYKLSFFTDTEGNKLFSSDLRGKDMFVELIFDKQISLSTEYNFGKETRKDLHEQVAFVALKNGKHSGIGYFLDTGLTSDPWPTGQLPLSQLFYHVLDIMGDAKSAPRSHHLVGGTS